MATGIVVVFVLFMVISGAASISGGSINPAVGIAQLLFQKFIVKNYYNSFNNGSGEKVESSLNCMPEYVIGPYVGALLAGLWKHWDTNTRI